MSTGDVLQRAAEWIADRAELVAELEAGGDVLWEESDNEAAALVQLLFDALVDLRDASGVSL